MGDLMPNHDLGRQPLSFLGGGGEMGERTRAFDWSRTPVGPVEAWPQSLKTIVRVMLDSRYQMAVWWGRELTNFYNDAYIPVLGQRHPDALGKAAASVWSEIWNTLGPQADIVMNEGRATWNEERLLIMERNGFLEETYFTFSYSPVPKDDGGVGGLLIVCTEDTQRTIGERRLRTLRELAARTTGESRSAEDACETAAHILEGNPQDVPFALLYMLDAEGRTATLTGACGVGRDTPLSPSTVDLRGPEGPWLFRRVVETGKSVEVHDLVKTFGSLPGGAWPEPSNKAVVLPMTKPGQLQLAGFVVAGISPRRLLDDAYRGFLELLAGQVGTAIANARAYEEERRRAERLAELDRAKTAFFSNVSHEFRTPLTLMLGPVEDLLSRSHTDLTPAAAAQLEVVNRNGLRLLRLVNTLLDFSRIEAGRAHAVYQPTELDTFTEDLASVFRAAIERAGLRLVVDCPKMTEPVFVDREMWEKIVLNLLSNAFKFTHEGEIAVSLQPTGNAVELQVRDTGSGISAEEIPRLFERFHRIPNARGRTHEGSGIGLALVHELVKLHGGSVSAESVVGKGTTFTVSVPLGKAHLPSEQIREARHGALTGSGASPYVEEALRWLPDEKDQRPELPARLEPLPTPHSPSVPIGEDDRPRVLVADDNADMRQYVARLLAESFQVEVVPDGAAALAAIRQRPPALILTDVMMPRLDGFGLLKEVRADARTSSIPVIMLSARAGEESRVEGLEAGADDYLVKPFSARELLARVSAHLQMARLRRESQQVVRESEERLRMALTAARMAAWQYDPATDRIIASENLADLLGLPPGSTLVSSEQGFPLVHPEDVDRHRATVMGAIEAGRNYVSQFRLIRPDNQEVVWLEEHGHTRVEGEGPAVRAVGVIMDITARKRAEEELCHSLERERLRAVELETVMSAVPAVVWIAHDPDCKRITGNRVSRELLRLPQDANQSLSAPPDERPTRFKVYKDGVELRPDELPVQMAATGIEVRDMEEEIVFDDGTRIHLFGHAMPLKDSEGRVRGSVAAFVDITERKRAEVVLRDSEAHFRSMADNAPVKLWVTDRTGYCTYLSRRWYEFTGRPVGGDVGFGWLEAIHPDDVEQARRVFLDANAHHESFTLDYRVRRHDGEYRWTVDTASPRFVDGVFQGFVGCVFDVHDRKLAEEELRRVAADLSEADRRKDEFLATLAHELRNPLAPIRNGLQIMKLARGDSAAVEKSRSMMERQISQMTHLINDLMDLSRISQGKIVLQKTRLRLADAIQDAVDTARPLIEERNHALVLDVPPEPLYVDADRTRLSQVFGNLLNNAAKYTEAGGRIRLGVGRQKSEVIVSVEDNGVGIPAPMLSRVFDMFAQVDRSLEKAQGGLGIGLNIVKRLVEMHGGSIVAESGGQGQGSRFVVRLPVALAVTSDGPRNEHNTKPKTPRRRILVADDNRDAASSLAMLLDIIGNETQTANDGLEALEIGAVFHPDVVLLDIGMPRLNGLETCRRIRQQAWGRNIIIVACTGWGQEDDRRQSKEAGFDFHMVKPVDPTALEKLLTELKEKTG